MSAGLPDGRNMWIRAFYGFDPEKDGYVGWTNASGQARALRELKDGDLMMICITPELVCVSFCHSISPSSQTLFERDRN